jgi:NAD(P)-dependent dehydrogenase (short-subunit alcohol dehydrogenase family)
VGLAQFTLSTAAQWGPRGMRVAAIAPGRTLTPMNWAVLNDPYAKRRALENIPAPRFGEA